MRKLFEKLFFREKNYHHHVQMKLIKNMEKLLMMKIVMKIIKDDRKKFELKMNILN
jgi:hypothetical protein